jgi:MFS family permease
MAIRVGVGLGGTSMGAPIVGWVANHFGPRWSLGIGAVSAFLAALVAALMMAKPVAFVAQEDGFVADLLPDSKSHRNLR